MTSIRQHVIPMILALFICLSATGIGVADLSLLDAGIYQSGVSRLIVHNAGPTALDLAGFEVLHADEKPIPTVWKTVEPRIVDSGKEAVITYLPVEPDPVGASSILSIQRNHLHYSAEPKPMEVTYAVYEPEDKKVCVFIKNHCPSECTIHSLSVAGKPVVLEHPKTIPHGQKQIFCGHWQAPEDLHVAVPQFAGQAGTDKLGPVTLFVRLFRPEHTVSVTAERMPDLYISCLSHAFSSPEAAGLAAITRGWHIRSRLRTIKFCNFDLGNNALSKFGQIGDACQIQLQTVYDKECVNGTYMKPVCEAVLSTKLYVEPGIFHVKMYADDCRKADKPLFPISVIHNIAYASIAGGAKGLALQPPAQTDLPATFRTSLTRLLKELDSLTPLIAFSDPVDWARINDDAWCTAHALLCTNGILLLILLPKQNCPTDVHSAVISLENCELPDTATAIEVGFSNEMIPFKREATGRFSLTVQPGGLARIFLIEQRASAMSSITPFPKRFLLGKCGKWGRRSW